VAEPVKVSSEDGKTSSVGYVTDEGVSSSQESLLRVATSGMSWWQDRMMPHCSRTHAGCWGRGYGR
jgi:hypothetical protein